MKTVTRIFAIIVLALIILFVFKNFVQAATSEVIDKSTESKLIEIKCQEWVGMIYIPWYKDLLSTISQGILSKDGIIQE